MKKYKKYLVIIILPMILGLFFAFVNHNGFAFTFKESIRSIKWYLYPLLVLFFFFFTILVHELGHFFSFIFNGVKIRALYVLMFILMKNGNNKWRFKIKLANLKLLGGLVVPNFSEVENEDDLRKLRKAFEKALIAGPNTSIAYFVVILIAFFLLWFLTTWYILIAIMFVNLIMTTLLTILVVLTSKVRTEEVFGDYKAYELIKENETFMLIQVIQYFMFSLTDTKKTEKFLFEYLTSYLSNYNLSYHFFDLTLVKNYLSMYLDNDNVMNDTLVKILNYYNLSRLIRSKHGYELVYLISATYYKNNELEEAYRWFNKAKTYENKFQSAEEREFIIKQYEHLLNLNNNETYLLNSKELIEEQLFILSPLVDIDEIINDMVKKLEFKSYYTKLYSKI